MAKKGERPYCPLVLVEINEVPFEILDKYAEQHAGCLRDLLARSDRYRCFCPDLTQLDPWIAWPTLHRGVNDEVHGIRRLGQDTRAADDLFPPIWRRLKDAGLKVGVFGSLFSSAERDHRGYSFFVPDVFSPHDRVKPPSLGAFQSFNLAMTRASARNADREIAVGGMKAMWSVARSGRLSFQTAFRLARQIAAEKTNADRVSRRRNSQTEISGDIFVNLLKETKPDFATFYANNVAAAMHRYWSAGEGRASRNAHRIDQSWMKRFSGEIDAALASIEIVIARLIQEFPDATILIASALGQEEIPAKNHSRFLTITDVDRFVSFLVGDDIRVGGGPGDERADYVQIPAMVPDFTLRIADTRAVERIVERLGQLALNGEGAVRTLTRMAALRAETAGNLPSFIRHDYSDEDNFKLPVTFEQSDAHTLHLSFQIDDYAGPHSITIANRTVSFDEAGLGFVSHDEGVNCTAQHSPEGVLLVHRGSAKLPRTTSGQAVATTQIVPAILQHFGLPGDHRIATAGDLRI